MKTFAVALSIVIIIFVGAILVYYYYSYYPYVEDMRLNVSQTRSTVGPNERDLTEILTKSEPETVRVTATLIMYSDLVFKERQRQWPIHWKFDQVLWHIFSFIHFSNNDMAMLYFAYMPSPYSRDTGIKSFSWYYFEKNVDSLTRPEMALLVALSYYPVEKDRIVDSIAAKKARKLLSKNIESTDIMIFD